MHNYISYSLHWQPAMLTLPVAGKGRGCAPPGGQPSANRYACPLDPPRRHPASSTDHREKGRRGLLWKRSEPLAYLQVALWPSRHALAPAPSHMSESSRRSLSSGQPLTIPLRRRLESAQTSCGHRRGSRNYVCNYSFFTPSSSAPTSPASPSSPSNHLPNCPSSTPPSSSTKSAILRSFLLRAL